MADNAVTMSDTQFMEMLSGIFVAYLTTLPDGIEVKTSDMERAYQELESLTMAEAIERFRLINHEDGRTTVHFSPILTAKT